MKVLIDFDKKNFLKNTIFLESFTFHDILVAIKTEIECLCYYTKKQYYELTDAQEFFKNIKILKEGD